MPKAPEGFQNDWESVQYPTSAQMAQDKEAAAIRHLQEERRNNAPQGLEEQPSNLSNYMKKLWESKRDPLEVQRDNEERERGIQRMKTPESQAMLKALGIELDKKNGMPILNDNDVFMVDTQPEEFQQYMSQAGGSDAERKRYEMLQKLMVLED